MDFTLLPEHMRPGMQRWVDHGIEPGDCLKAILCNDLHETITRVDSSTLLALRGIVVWLDNYAPPGAWGSPEKYDAWRLAKIVGASE